MLYSKEWYEIMELFEKNCNGRFRFDRETKEMWKIGAYYENGECNEWFKIYLAGYMAGRAVYLN